MSWLPIVCECLSCDRLASLMLPRISSELILDIEDGMYTTEMSPYAILSHIERADFCRRKWTQNALMDEMSCCGHTAVILHITMVINI